MDLSEAQSAHQIKTFTGYQSASIDSKSIEFKFKPQRWSGLPNYRIQLVFTTMGFHMSMVCNFLYKNEYIGIASA